MAEKRRNLGRGLSALLGDDTATPARAGGAQQIAIGKLHPGRYQPRRTMGEDELKDLSQSIRELGVLQPILVREHPDRALHIEVPLFSQGFQLVQDRLVESVQMMRRFKGLFLA